MANLQELTLYFFLFIGLYFQVFILFTYLINRKKIDADGKCSFERSSYPSVTIVVPAWNEEHTIDKTVQSLLALNYPSDKLRIVLVDDGSTDNTWNAIQHYKTHDQIEIYQKENGGKHTAVNYAIDRCTTDLFGCLDADSFVDTNTLKKIVCKFDNPSVMAVTPAMKIHNPKTVIQFIQSVEYIFGILVKKVMAVLGAIHVTPGPFTIFRKNLFDTIGKFKKAHNTEDMEIAFRMQANHLAIENAHTAWVYTTGPTTLKKLYKQRLRWTYGFLQNVRDYKFLFLNRRYGNMGIFTLPIATTLIFGVIYSAGFVVYRILESINKLFLQWRTVGIVMPQTEFDPFFISAKIHFFLIIFVYFFMIALVYTAHKLTQEKTSNVKAMLLYFILFPLVSPLWVVKSVYNVIVSQTTTWR